MATLDHETLSTYGSAPPEGGGPSVEYRILGSLEVSSSGTTPDLGPHKQRALLAILLLHANEIVPTDRLIDLLWGDRPPRTANHSIQIYVSELRKAIAPLAEDQVIITRSPGYRLDADPSTIDAWRFEALLNEATRELREGDAGVGSEKLRAAMALWRGPALSEFAYDEFAQSEIRRLTDLRLAGLEELAAVELAAGRSAQAMSVLETAIREDPLRERLRELMMLALYRTGRHAEALRTYEAFRAKLGEELGLDPSPPLQRLQERILLHDPDLVPPATEPPTGPSPARNPFKGLRPFGEDDAHDFFGRASLEDEVLRALGDGVRLVALVGPSGSGKSSVVAAGVIPRLRAGALPGSERWTIVSIVPGSHPFGELEAARAERGNGTMLLVIDQFEETFSLPAEVERERFLRDLAAAVADPDGGFSVLVTLRADFYGAPLLEPDFAEVFTSGVLNVLPMTAREIGEAVTGPAERVGARVEPALAAELVADTAGQPGALPLLQFALTELFERQGAGELTLDGYRALGGLRGVVSRRAESLYGHLDAEERPAAMQVFLRMVRLGHGTEDARRRVPLSELTALDLDPVALSEVLERFGRHRLLSFDRDVASGHAIVEVAHEALLWEWERLAAWIEQYRADLGKHDTFLAAVGEWEASGRNEDYLLTGGRLAEYEAWSRRSTLRLTAGERAFLEAGLERRRVQETEESSRRDQERRLERRARSRLAGLVVAAVLLAGMATYGALTWLGNRPPDVVFLDSRASGVLGDGVAAGLDRAVSDLGIRGERSVAAEAARPADLLAASERGPDVVISLWEVCGYLDPVARAYPEIQYLMIECVFGVPDLPNVASVTFASEQGSYLAGAAAAMKSETGVIGFVGGWDHPLIWAFQAGYEAGARAVNPEIEIRSVYLSDLSGQPLDAEPIAFREATRMYEKGADVIFPAAGASDYGVFEAARQESGPGGRHVWGIGAGVDMYDPPENPYYPYILTSVVKRFDVAVSTLLDEYASGTWRTGLRHFDLASGGVGITYRGGYLDEFRPALEAIEADIVSGAIEVPCIAEDKLGQAAARFGVDLSNPCVPAPPA